MCGWDGRAGRAPVGIGAAHVYGGTIANYDRLSRGPWRYWQKRSSRPTRETSDNPRASGRIGSLRTALRVKVPEIRQRAQREHDGGTPTATGEGFPPLRSANPSPRDRSNPPVPNRSEQGPAPPMSASHRGLFREERWEVGQVYRDEQLRTVVACAVHGAAHGVHVQQVVRCRHQQLVEPGLAAQVEATRPNRPEGERRASGDGWAPLSCSRRR